MSVKRSLLRNAQYKQYIYTGYINMTTITKSLAKSISLQSLSLKQLADIKSISTTAASRQRKAGTYLASHEGLYEINGNPVILDKEFADIITILNSLGYTTRACCAGHLNQPNSLPYIAFEFDTVPDFTVMDKSYVHMISYQYIAPCSVALYFKDVLDIVDERGSLTKKQQEQYLKDLHKAVLAWVEQLENKAAHNEESNMRTYNVSKEKINYSQRNNEVNPNRSCNTTSMTMAASYLPEIWKLFTESPIYKKYAKKFKQPEDCLQQYMLDSGLRPTYHEDLSKAMNEFCGKKVTKFSMAVSLTKLVNELKASRPVVISGDFPKSDGKTLGHIVCLVGCIFNNDNKTNVPDYWIIDDPYGDTMNDWRGSGNDIKLTHEYFMKYIKEKGQDKKWGHTFTV